MFDECRVRQAEIFAKIVAQSSQPLFDVGLEWRNAGATAPRGGVHCLAPDQGSDVLQERSPFIRTRFEQGLQLGMVGRDEVRVLENAVARGISSPSNEGPGPGFAAGGLPKLLADDAREQWLSPFALDLEHWESGEVEHLESPLNAVPTDAARGGHEDSVWDKDRALVR